MPQFAKLVPTAPGAAEIGEAIDRLPTKTLYVREEDQSIWDQARELVGDNLSTYITTHLKALVAAKKAEQQGFARSVVNYNDAQQSGLPRSNHSFGRWIIPVNEPYQLSGEDETDYYAVAITANKNLVVYKRPRVRPEMTCGGMRFYTVGSFEEAVAEHEVRLAIIEARRRVGVPTEELDI